MNFENLHLVVMAGGSGTRFWPKSTSRRPKQLLSFGSDRSSTLLVQTLSRFDGIVPPGNRIIVTTQILQDAVREQAPSVTVLAEPQGRNTAPCIYWAARAVAASDSKALMLVMPSDHYIAKPAAFQATVEQAAAWALQHDDLVTLGVKPNRPETGYGYLRMGAPLTNTGPSASGYRVDAFVEKPNLDKAKAYLQLGNYLWNGGMFLWRAEVILDAFDRFMPEMKKAWEESEGKVQSAYPKMTATSIDYGIMEKAENVVTFPLDCGWDDLGSWISLENLASVLGAKRPGGVVTGGELVSIDSDRNIVDAPGRLVALLGVHDLIVVEQGDAILIARKDQGQDIRRVVEEVRRVRPDLA